MQFAERVPVASRRYTKKAGRRKVYVCRREDCAVQCGVKPREPRSKANYAVACVRLLRLPLVFEPFHRFVFPIVAHELHEVGTFLQRGGGEDHAVGSVERDIEEVGTAQIDH